MRSDLFGARVVEHLNNNSFRCFSRDTIVRHLSTQVSSPVRPKPASPSVAGNGESARFHAAWRSALICGLGKCGSFPTQVASARSGHVLIAARLITDRHARIHSCPDQMSDQATSKVATVGHGDGGEAPPDAIFWPPARTSSPRPAMQNVKHAAGVFATRRTLGALPPAHGRP